MPLQFLLNLTKVAHLFVYLFDATGLSIAKQHFYKLNQSTSKKFAFALKIDFSPRYSIFAKIRWPNSYFKQFMCSSRGGGGKWPVGGGKTQPPTFRHWQCTCNVRLRTVCQLWGRSPFLLPIGPFKLLFHGNSFVFHILHLQQVFGVKCVRTIPPLMYNGLVLINKGDLLFCT